MIQTNDIVDRIDQDWPRRPLELEAEGHFHVILGTKDEHDGIKVYASNPRIIESLLKDDRFRPEMYYCSVEDTNEGVTFEPDELSDHFDRVTSVGAVDGMLPYDAVTIEAGSSTINIEDVIDL